jgi:hypothetical protein
VIARCGGTELAAFGFERVRTSVPSR